MKFHDLFPDSIGLVPVYFFCGKTCLEIKLTFLVWQLLWYIAMVFVFLLIICYTKDRKSVKKIVLLIDEEDGRWYFMFYLRPIIIESSLLSIGGKDEENEDENGKKNSICGCVCGAFIWQCVPKQFSGKCRSTGSPGRNKPACGFAYSPFHAACSPRGASGAGDEACG
jgi:hypothetical protein